MELSDEIKERIQKLSEKYDVMGQDMVSYLDGLLYSKYLTYWDYVHLDTLLSLQTPRTDFPDEEIFIIYHQITELYFKLIINEIRQLVFKYADEVDEWKKRMSRVTNYFKNLAQSFDVMVAGMEQEQFLKFRMALLPASGFQSAQYRKIEVMSSPLIRLVKADVREELANESKLDKLYEALYWKYGNLELKTGKKTLTLRMFEKRYDEELLKLAAEFEQHNLATLFENSSEDIKGDQELRDIMRDYDAHANLFWPLSHYKAAVRYLFRDPDIIAATGGTNWQRFLPPNFQRIIYLPELWIEEEKAEWGKQWVLDLFREKVETNWSKIR